jgi:hypothetical protein
LARIETMSEIDSSLKEFSVPILRPQQLNNQSVQHGLAFPDFAYVQPSWRRSRYAP